MPLDVKKVRKLMGDRSEYEVADAAGIGRQTLRRIMAGKDFLWSNFERLAEALGVKPWELLR